MNFRRNASTDRNPRSLATLETISPPSNFRRATTILSRFIQVFGGKPTSRMKIA